MLQQQAVDRWYALVEKYGYIRLNDPSVQCQTCFGSAVVDSFDFSENMSKGSPCGTCFGLGVDLDVVETNIEQLILPDVRPKSVTLQDILNQIDLVEELPGPMPIKVWEEMSKGSEVVADLMRGLVMVTKSEAKELVRRLFKLE